MTITWRNIDIGGSGNANALLASGAQQVTRGIDQLTEVAAQQGATQSSNWDKVSQNNTNDLLARLNTYTSSKQLAEEMQGGEFATDKLDSNFGRQYNKAALSQALAEKRTNLLTLEKADKLTADAELNKKVTLEKANRIKKFDAAANQLITKYSDPNVLQSQLWAAARNLNADGIMPLDELGRSVDSIVARVKGVGLDETSQIALKIQQDRVPAMITEGTSAVDSALAEFKRKGNYDQNTEVLLADQTSVADAMNKLRTQITEKGGNLPDTTVMAARIDDLNNLFTSEGLAPRNGRIVYELLTQGGHKDQWIGGVEFELNTDFAKNMISKIKTNQLFRQSNADALSQFAAAKANITDTTTLAVASNMAEALRASRAKAFTGESHDPQIIQLDSINERNKMLVDELRKIKPAGMLDTK